MGGGRGAARNVTRRRSHGVLRKVAGRVAHWQPSDLRTLPQSRLGVRLINGEPYYSADWLDRPPPAALPQVRGDAD